jgi:hypothetical protein
MEEPLGALRGCPETRRQSESGDLPGQRNRRRPSCCKTFAAVHGSQPGARLAGTPSKGKKIWDRWALPTDATVDPQNRRPVPTAPRLAKYKPLRIWHFLALIGPLSEGVYLRKSIQVRSYEILKNGQVHSRLRHLLNRPLRRTRHRGETWAHKQPILPKV